MISMSDLAARKGVSVQAIDKRVKGLERDGLITTEKRGRKRMVDMAAYDRAVGEVGDAVRESAVQSAKQSSAPSHLRDNQAELAAYKARMAQLDLAERYGQIIPTKGHAGLESAVLRVGTEIAQEIDGLINFDARLAKAAATGGAIAVRKELKSIAIEMRTAIANKLASLADLGAQAERDAEADGNGYLLTEVDFSE